MKTLALDWGERCKDGVTGTLREILLLHSAYGLRPALLDAAARLRSLGYAVVAPDLYDGRTARTVDEAIELRDAIGRQALIERIRRAAAGRSAVAVVGFSLGGSLAQSLVIEGAITTRGLLLFHGTGPLPDPAAREVRPLGIPIELHVADPDPFEPLQELAAWERGLLEYGARVTVHRYPGCGHLFTDPGLPDFDRTASEMAWTRGLAFLARVAPPRLSVG